MILKLRRVWNGLALAAAALLSLPAGAVPVGVELSMILDYTGSMIGGGRLASQRDAFKNAFLDPTIQALILAQPGGIAVNVITFNQAPANIVEQITWTHLQTASEITGFANAIGALPLTTVSGFNNYARAFEMARLGMASNAFEGSRLVIDVSTDEAQKTDLSGSAMINGVNCGATNNMNNPNCTGIIENQRNLAAIAGITIDALVTLAAVPMDIEAYFENHVITSDGFIQTSATWDDVGPAALQKLARELAVPEPGTIALLALGIAGLAGWRRRAIAG